MTAVSFLSKNFFKSQKFLLLDKLCLMQVCFFNFCDLMLFVRFVFFMRMMLTAFSSEYLQTDCSHSGSAKVLRTFDFDHSDKKYSLIKKLLYSRQCQLIRVIFRVRKFLCRDLFHYVIVVYNFDRRFLQPKLLKNTKDSGSTRLTVSK